MLAEKDTAVIKKRSLKKVRTQFLHKKEDSDEEKQVDTATKYLSCNNMFMLQTTLGLVEVDRKICAGAQYLKAYYKILYSIVENRSSKAVTLNVDLNKHMAAVPWEYSTKRLESYGNLELATLAHRIKKFHANLNTIIPQYEEAMRKNGNSFAKTWDQIIMKARKACQELDKNEVFYHVIYYFSKDSSKVISSTYSEGLLRAIGFKPESFIEWAEINGPPTIFDPECLVFQSAVKMFFDFALFQENSICQSAEYETYLYDSAGSKRKTLVTPHYVLEPVADGFFTHYYFIVKEIEPSSSINKSKYQESLDEDVKHTANIKPEPNFEEHIV